MVPYQSSSGLWYAEMGMFTIGPCPTKEDLKRKCIEFCVKELIEEECPSHYYKDESYGRKN